MTDNLPKKDEYEVIPDNREIDRLDQPDYRYGFDQEPLDSRRLKNKGFGDKKNLGNDIVYYAEQSGLVIATALSGLNVTIAGYNGLTPTLGSSEMVAYGAFNGGDDGSGQPNITFFVNKGTYYKVTSNTGVGITYFTPLF